MPKASMKTVNEIYFIYMKTKMNEETANQRM